MQDRTIKDLQESQEGNVLTFSISLVTDHGPCGYDAKAATNTLDDQ